MTIEAFQFTGDVPQHYDTALGPVMFEPYARDIAARVARLGRPVQKVLELAAGTGIVTRKLRNVLPENASLIATDLNAAMLDIAKPRFRPGEKVTFQPADAMKLPFADGEFDLVVCQYGVMFFPDKVAAFREARRVLSPGGHYIFNVWGSLAANPFAEAAVEIGDKMYPHNPPKFYRTPFSYADTAAVIADAKAGGFADVKCTKVEFNQTVADWKAYAAGLVRGNPMAGEIEAMDPGGSDRARDALTANLRARFGDSPAKMPLQAFVYDAS
jgi:ubiquinone/menaquinone biosynthesis C-methylase UbiE